MAKLTPESAWEFADAIKSIVKPQTTRRKATVQSVDKDGTIWVNLPGSSTVTPIQSTGANVSPGDTVLTELRGTSLHITENQTNPAIGENTARSIARQETQHAEVMAEQAKTIADEANAVAEATNQHFWNDTNGAHITDVTQDEWTAAVADNFSDYDPDTKPYHNQLLNSLGILLRTALNNLVSITRSAIAFYDGAGNAASNIVARFGSDGAQIGAADKSHIELTNKNLNVLDDTGETISYIGSNKTTVDITEYIMKNPSSQTYTLSRNYVSGSVTAKDASGAALTVREGNLKSVLITGAISGNYLVVSYTTNDEITCFKFGDTDNAAYGGYSLSESTGSAYADYSHAEGLDTKAYGVASHAQNEGTIAAWRNQTAIGRFNEIDPGKQYSKQSGGGVVNYYDSKYALIIGNGTADDARSNALAVKWNGDITDGSGALKYAPIAHGMLSNLSSALSLTTTAQTLALSNFAGVNCAKSSNGIKVDQAGSYLIAGHVYLHSGFTTNDIIHAFCTANSTTVAETINRVPGANPYTIVGVGPVIATLAAGDTVYLKAYNQTAARGSIVDRAASNDLIVTRVG